MEVQRTGGWSEFETIGSLVDLEAGQQKMRIVMGRGTFNLGDIDFVLAQDDVVPPTVTISSVGETVGDVQSPAAGRKSITISGTASDNVLVERRGLIVRDEKLQLFWNGSDLTSTRKVFAPTYEDSTDWSFTLDLPVGRRYRLTAWVWDASGNRTRADYYYDAVESDLVLPTITIDSIAGNTQSSAAGLKSFTINGTATDNHCVDRIGINVRDSTEALFWNGSAITGTRRLFAPTYDEAGRDWSLTLDLPIGRQFRMIAWVWDSSGNRTKAEYLLNVE